MTKKWTLFSHALKYSPSFRICSLIVKTLFALLAKKSQRQAPPFALFLKTYRAGQIPTSNFNVRTSNFNVPTLNFNVQTSIFDVQTSNSNVRTSNSNIHTLNFNVPTLNFNVQTSNFDVQTLIFDVQTSNFNVRTSIANVLTPPAAARLYRVTTSLKSTQYPIIHPFNHYKANKIYTFRIFELIISTHCYFYSFVLLYFYLSYHAIQSHGSEGDCQ